MVISTSPLVVELDSSLDFLAGLFFDEKFSPETEVDSLVVCLSFFLTTNFFRLVNLVGLRPFLLDLLKGSLSLPEEEKKVSSFLYKFQFHEKKINFQKKIYILDVIFFRFWQA